MTGCAFDPSGKTDTLTFLAFTVTRRGLLAPLRRSKRIAEKREGEQIKAFRYSVAIGLSLLARIH